MSRFGFVIKNVDRDRYFAGGRLVRGSKLYRVSLTTDFSKAVKFKKCETARRKAFMLNKRFDPGFVNAKTGEMCDYAMYTVRVVGLCGGRR